MCAGIIGFRSLRVAGTQPGERVGLFGFGASAHLAIEVLHAWKCDVYVSTRGESHRKLAESLGAKWVGAETERPPVGLDRAITFAPSGDVVVAALSSLRKGGVVAINAIHLDHMPEFDYDTLLWGERQIRSVANMTREDARDFLNLAAKINLHPKVTSFSLDQANEALLAVKGDAIDGQPPFCREAVVPPKQKTLGWGTQPSVTDPYMMRGRPSSGTMQPLAASQYSTCWISTLSRTSPGSSGPPDSQDL